MTNVFKATYIDQYTQTVNLQPGIYTFQALVYFHSDSNDGKYSISFTDAEGGIFNINLNWQVEPNTWCMVTQTFELEKTMVLFSLMASPLFTGEYILIGLPQAEEGESKSTPRANPLDDTEELKDEIDLVRSFISSQVDILEDRIVLKVGEYQIGGKNFLRNFDGRFGTDFWGEGVELVDENGDPIPVHILSVTAPNPISVYVNSTPEVPETVKLVLDNGTSVNVPVDWGVIDTSVVGEQSIQGIYELPEGVTGDMPEVFLEVLVVALTVVSVTPLAQVSVDQYRVPSLPTTIELNLNNQTSIEVPVTWGEYSTNTAGTFEITAIYDLPSGVSGYKPTVKITLVVNEVVDTGTFIDVIPYLTSIKESGTDDWGNWIKPNYQYFDAITAHMVEGQARIYARYRNGTTSTAMIFYYKNATPALRYSVTLPPGSNYAMGLGNYISGVFESAEWTGSGDIKLYNLELRNDGSVPPWYIE
jgi:hypothetical protein